MQDRLTSLIAEAVRGAISPVGVAVVMEATHLCVAMRGVEKQNSLTVTSAMRGAFREDARVLVYLLECLALRSDESGPRGVPDLTCNA